MAGPLLCILAWCSEGGVSLRREDYWRFLLTGVCLYFNNLCYIVGVKNAGATAAGVWQPAQPVFITLLAIFFKYEKATFGKFFGIAVAGAGCIAVVLLGAKSGKTAGALNPALGNMCLFVQGVACSGFYVSEKPLLERRHIYIYIHRTFTYPCISIYPYNVMYTFIKRGDIYMIQSSYTNVPSQTRVALAVIVGHSKPILNSKYTPITDP